MFFMAISSPAPYSNEVDLGLKVLREEFLCLVVTNVIGKVPEDLDNSEDPEIEPRVKIYMVLYIYFILRIALSMILILVVDIPITEWGEGLRKLDP